MMIQICTFPPMVEKPTAGRPASTNGVKASTVTKVVMVATDTPNLGITSKPQNLGVTLTTQTTGSFRSFMVELQICNSPINHRRISAFGHSLIICVIIMIIQQAQFCALLKVQRVTAPTSS
ncbi:TPA: hypothetical protein ACHYKY_005356, partial [Escherichia coli]